MMNGKIFSRVARLFFTVFLLWMTFSSFDFLSGTKVKAESTAFTPTVVRGFNSSAFGQVKRAKEMFGANVMRLMLTPRTEAASRHISVSDALDLQLTKLESSLQEAARQGMYVVIDMHDAPIEDLNLKTNSSQFWNDNSNRDALIHSWERIVQRFAPYRSYIWGYDLLNEPYNAAELPLGAANWPAWAQAITDAIRVYDQSTPIIMEVGPGALPRGFIENRLIDAGPGYPVKYQGDFPLLKDEKVIYSVHMYEPPFYTHQGLSTFNKATTSTDWPDKMTYPGINGGVYWDKSKLREQLQPVIDIQKKYHVPIYVGEFSAIRWAPGAAQYIRDCIELFEELGWSWTYHAFMEWQGWDVEYNELMTSDANRQAAKASEPTDRELILKSYFNKNTFQTPTDYPVLPSNLISNGGFENDSNQDGLADSWIKGANAAASIVVANNSKAQKVTIPSNGQGLDQEWIAVSDKNKYRLKAKIRVDQGSLNFWHYDVTDTFSLVGSSTVSTITNTNGQFVTKEIEFVPQAKTGRMSIRFWANSASTFFVDDVELIDLGPVLVVHPPETTANKISPGHLEFMAAAFDGAAIARTEYRIVGENSGWSTVPNDGLTLSASANYIVAYRSVDTSGNIERAKSLLVDALAPVTSASLSPAQPDGLNGWYVHPVTVTLTATDDLSGVAKTEYSLDGGSQWQLYSGPVTFSQDALYSVLYRSTDRAGNIETPQKVSFQLDMSAPLIAVTSPDSMDYEDAKDLTMRFTVVDELSGVDNSKTVVTLDGQTVQQETIIPLYSLSLGTHTLVVTATDMAGNTGSHTVTFQVVTSIHALKELVTRFVQEGFIDNEGIANSLQAKLDQNDLGSFVKEIDAQSGKHISSKAATYLLRDARFLLNR